MTYQVAVTVDLLVAGVANRADHPSVNSVLPEGWEDIDVNTSRGGKLFVQAKERAPDSQNLGAVAVADVVVHAALGMHAAGELDSGGHIGLVTDCTLGSGLTPTGWTASVSERTPPELLAVLGVAVRERLASAGLDPTLSGDLLRRTSIVHRPWNHSEETQHDLAQAYGVAPAIAWLAFTVLVERVGRIAAEQRSTPVDAPIAVTATDLSAIVDDVSAAVDLASLNEAVAAGVCAPVDFLRPSDLTLGEFFAGVDAAPSHIAAGLDVVRNKELATVLEGLAERRHVLIAGPSGSGKSALLWRTAKTLTLNARVLRVFRVSSDDDAVLLARHLQRTRPSPSAPVVLCADNVGSPNMTRWPSGLERVLENPGVYVVSSVRREDYLPTLIHGGVVVDSSLERESAEAIFAALREAGVSTNLEVEEAIEQAEGLLMEFIALATTGKRLRGVLSAQLQPLRSTERSFDRNVLRLVCAAHTLGWSVDAGRIAARLSPADPALVGDSLSRLEGEHLIIHDLAMGEWRGIHDLRAEIIQEILHGSPPPTLGESMCEVVPLLPPLSRPRAVVRAAELLARQCTTTNPAGPPALDRLVATLRPLAALVGHLFTDGDLSNEQAASYSAGLLQTGIRIDAIAYAYATLPRVEAGCPPALDAADLACLLYSVHVDGLALTGLPGTRQISALARTLPSFTTQLSERLAERLGGARLIEIAGRASLGCAAELLEAAEGLIALDLAQAREAWQRLVPALPAPPGEGFDTGSADRRARIASALVSLAGLTGPEVADALGPVQERADDAVACDPDAAAVSLRLKQHDATDDADLLQSTRRATWSPTELLVAEASILYRNESTLSSGYLPLPNEGDGVNRRAVRACRRLLDACPEIDRADIAVVEPNWKPIGYGDMVFGKKSIRAGVLRVTPSTRRNIAYQAAVARMRTAASWSARLRLQLALSNELLELLRQLPRRLRIHDNERRVKEWAGRLAAAETSAAALPRRPSMGRRAAADTSVAKADEASRAVDPEQHAFADIARGLAAAGEAVRSGERIRFNNGAHLLEQARMKLEEARASGMPTFAAVGDPLPPELDRLTKESERLLWACGVGDTTLRRIKSAVSDEQLFERVANVATSQDESDRRLLGDWLASHGFADVRTETIEDSNALAARLNSSRTVAFVDLDDWDACAQALWASALGDWDEATGRLVVIAAHEGMVLPIGLSAIGSAGSWMPSIDPEEFQRIGDDTGMAVVNGPHLALFRNTVKELAAWSGAVQLRARRPESWLVPAMPRPTPTDTRRTLTDALERGLGRTGPGRAMVERLIVLAGLVAEEGGGSVGLAGRLVDSVTTPGPGADPDELGAIALLAMAADIEACRPTPPDVGGP